MEQFELNTNPEARASKEYLQAAAEHLQEALRSTVRARSAEEAYGRISLGLTCVKGLEKEAKKALDKMPASFTDSKTSIELVNRIKEIAEALGSISVQWAVTANLCIKDLTFQKYGEDE